MSSFPDNHFDYKRSSMMNLTIFDTLLKLPFFTGMSKADLSYIVEHAKFDFRKYRNGQTIAREGEPCTQMFFVLSGVIRQESRTNDGSCVLTEFLQAPTAMQLDALFGLHTHFTSSFVADGEVGVLCLDKGTLLDMLLQTEIFRLNVLNHLCLISQRRQRKLWRHPGHSTEQHFIDFLIMRTEYPAGRKELSVTMDALAVLLNEGRTNISATLNRLQHYDLIKLKRGTIFIPAFEKLVQSYDELI